MADQHQSTGQNPENTPFKGRTLIRSPKETPERPTEPSTSTNVPNKRPAGSPLEGTSSKKQDSTEKYQIINQSENDQGRDNEMEAQFEIEESYGRNFEDVAEGINLMDRLQQMVAVVVRAKKTPSPTQSKQLTDMTQDVKSHLTRLQTKFLQFQGKSIEQSQTIDKLLAKGSRDVARIQETIINEVSKLSFPKPQTQMPAFSYASIARSGKTQEQPAKTRVLLFYPK